MDLNSFLDQLNSSELEALRDLNVARELLNTPLEELVGDLNSIGSLPSAEVEQFRQIMESQETIARLWELADEMDQATELVKQNKLSTSGESVDDGPARSTMGSADIAGRESRVGSLVKVLFKCMIPSRLRFDVIANFHIWVHQVQGYFLLELSWVPGRIALWIGRIIAGLFVARCAMHLIPGRVLGKVVDSFKSAK